MFRSHVLLAILVLFILSLVAIQPAKAICTDYAKAYTLLDSGLPVSSGVYDPCAYWLTWDYEFNRNDNNTGFTIIAFQIVGVANTSRSYDSRTQSPGSHKYTGVVYVGAASENEVSITKQSGIGGHFNFILGQAFYNNSNPTNFDE